MNGKRFPPDAVAAHLNDDAADAGGRCAVSLNQCGSLYLLVGREAKFESDGFGKPEIREWRRQTGPHPGIDVVVKDGAGILIVGGYAPEVVGSPGAEGPDLRECFSIVRLISDFVSEDGFSCLKYLC